MVAEPQKELRFTRSGQAVLYCVTGAVLVGVAVTILATGIYREINPGLPHPAWAIPCLVMAGACWWLAWHLTKHAYLILTPLGLEIFPFFRPAKGMQLITWTEIKGADVDERERWLTLHFNENRTAGMHLSLFPVRRKLRGLLSRAVLGRVEKS
ncbi:hypothetical protein [Luteolibacter sp. AS25]|uniref:hypothetical protein n=1 Tax=Luteolibacter sp. AS25 TaxID=3135776 RepID=UPI00398A5E52